VCPPCEAAATDELEAARATRIELPWAVLVLCAGGWKITARFVGEAAAWTYGATMLEARVSNGGECLGHKDGYKRPWVACDGTGPCEKGWT
jgi:hypothetical protein